MRLLVSITRSAYLYRWIETNHLATQETLTVSGFCHPVVGNMCMEHNHCKNRTNIAWQEIGKDVGLPGTMDTVKKII